MKPKQKIYYPVKVTFQKESQSLTVNNLRDRNIINNRKVIKQLRKQHQNAQNILMIKKHQLQKDKVKVRQQSKQLTQKQIIEKQKYIKNIVKRDQILSQVFINKYKQQHGSDFYQKGNKKIIFPQNVCPIVKSYVSLLSRYFHGYSQQKIYSNAKWLGGIKTFKYLRQFTLIAQLQFNIKPILKQNIGIHRLTFEKQQIIISQRQKSQQQILISVYNIKGKQNFHFEKSYNPLKQSQEIKVPEDNPLINLVILKKHKKMYSLKEYIQLNYFKVITSVKKLQFKIHFAKQRKKFIFFKVLKIDHFFQKKYNDFYFQQKTQTKSKDYFVDILVTVYITIQSIKSGLNSIFTFIITEKLDSEMATDFSLQKYFAKRIISLRKKQCIKMINYDNEYQSLIKIQSFVKKRIKYVEYASKKQKNKINLKFHKIYNKQSKILVTCIIQDYLEKKKSNQKIPQYLQIRKKLTFSGEENKKLLNQLEMKPFKVFFQCLSLRKSIMIQEYPSKYWKLCKNIFWIDNMNTVTQTRDTFNSLFINIIEQYQQQLQKTQLLKPQKYQNRLRRFFINLFLRNRVKKNIKFIKKVKFSFGTFVIMIRKSHFYKGILNINVYKLRSNQTTSIIHDKVTQQTYNITIAQKIFSLSKKKIKQAYQTIHIFDDYFKSYKNIQDQFYIDKQHFLLKPKKQIDQHFIQRIIPVDIQSQEITKQISIFQLQNGNIHNRNQQRKGSFLMSRDTIISSLSLPRVNDYKKCNYVIADNAHKSIIYYSLLKDSNECFYLDLYIVIQNSQNKDQQLQLIKRQLLNKKDLMESSWSFIHSYIAKWVVNNCKLENIQSLKMFTNNNFLNIVGLQNIVNLSTKNLPIANNSKDSIISEDDITSNDYTQQ